MKLNETSDLRFGGYIGQDMASLVNENGNLVAIVPCPRTPDGKRDCSMIAIVANGYDAVGVLGALTTFAHRALNGSGSYANLRRAVNEAAKVLNGMLHYPQPTDAPSITEPATPSPRVAFETVQAG